MLPGDVRMAETVLSFPTGGYCWPGMGTELAASPFASVPEGAEAALRTLGVPDGALRRLMAGEGQVRRVRAGDGWEWTGDFPLSMVAQTVVGTALARALIEERGPPRLLVGESMGEIAAYCVAGVLSIEEATRLTFRWARDLERASAELGELRMAVVEELDEGELEALPAALAARIVVSEAPRLLVVALPADRLGALEVEVSRRGGRTLVSNNRCAAHEPRLAGAGAIWAAHAELVAALPLAPPALPLVSTLDPGAPLAEVEALRQNRLDTTFVRVRYGETVAGVVAAGVRAVVQLGPPASLYALKRLRRETPALAGVRLFAVSRLAGTAPTAPAVD
jgi:acyl transferase domain-containing protein